MQKQHGQQCSLLRAERDHDAVGGELDRPENPVLHAFF